MGDTGFEPVTSRVWSTTHHYHSVSPCQFRTYVLTLLWQILYAFVCLFAMVCFISQCLVRFSNSRIMRPHHRLWRDT